jgi:hypothetical protein
MLFHLHCAAFRDSRRTVAVSQRHTPGKAVIAARTPRFKSAVVQPKLFQNLDTKPVLRFEFFGSTHTRARMYHILDELRPNMEFCYC